MKNILRLLTGYKTPISRTPNFFAPAYRTGRPLRLCALIFLCAFAPLRDLKAQKAIHELPAKTTIDTNYLFIQGNPTTGKLYKTRGAALNALISGGGGGSQTLDQVLTEGIVFTPTPSDLDYNFIKVNPIDTFSSQVPFRMTRWNVPQNSGAVAGNEGLMFGFNLNSGGGIIESGKPAIGFSIESNYLPDYATRYVEWHDLYIPSTTINGLTAGNQVRLSSYTINTATNNVDLYRRVGREYLMIPGSDVQYWLVQPGSLSLKDITDSAMFKVELAHPTGSPDWWATIVSDGVDVVNFTGANEYRFSGAKLLDFVLPSSLSIITPTITSGLNINSTTFIRDPGDLAKNINIDPQATNSALAIYGGGLNKIWTYNISELKMDYSSQTTSITHEGISYTGAGIKSIYGDDLTLKLGVNASVRLSEAWIKDGYFNNMVAQTKSTDPTTSDIGSGMWMVYKNTTANTLALWANNSGSMVNLTAGSGGTAWGDITGTLSDQTDLQTALNTKLNLAGGTMTGNLDLGSQNLIGGTKIALGLTSTKNPYVDLVVGDGGNGTDNEAFGLRLRGNSSDGNTRVIQMGVNTTGVGGDNQGYGYIQFGYWGGSQNNPLVLQPKAGAVVVGAPSGLSDYKLQVEKELSVKATSTDAGGALRGRLSFPFSSTYSAKVSYIAGINDATNWYESAGLVFATISGSDISNTTGIERMRISGNGNIGINTSGDISTSSAKLEIVSTTSGFLPPRMTKTQRDAISSPATGLVVYQTDNTPGLRCYNGTNWMRYTETAD